MVSNNLVRQVNKFNKEKNVWLTIKTNWYSKPIHWTL